MRICIHRGTKQIGGTCIELEAQGKRIALDVGLPLDAADRDDIIGLLPNVEGFQQPNDSLLGIVISHPHMDHYGLAKYVRPDVPIYIGEKSNAILKAASKFVANGTYFTNTLYYEAWKPTKIGPFTITPFLMDHSAFDAYALLIEADGKRVFYSGDFRGHGRKKQVFERFINQPPSDIDVLMMEGTNVGPEGQKKETQTEDDLEQKFIEDINQTKGLYCVCTSSQNIDRLVTLYRAAKRTGRKLLIDLYTAVILEAAGSKGIPQSTWQDVSVYIPQAQRVHVKKNGLFKDLNNHAANRIFAEELAEDPGGFVFVMRPWMRRDLDYAKCTEGARCAYSMWGGYLKEDYLIQFQAWLAERGIPISQIHTSGHAPISDLKRFANALSPKRLIPIHSFETSSFAKFFNNVEIKNDGEWWII